jgi:Fe-S-cluster containining protein
MEDEYWDRLKRERPELVEEIDKDMKANPFDAETPCLWYDPTSKNCKHYEYRPEICRNFLPGSVACCEHRLHQQIVTPGFSLEERA